MSISPGLDLFNLLLGLAWLGELDRHQIKRLWFVDKSMSTVEKTLAKLHKDELLAKRTWSVRDEERNVTVPQLARWSLTPKGHALVKASLRRAPDLLGAAGPAAHAAQRRGDSQAPRPQCR